MTIAAGHIGIVLAFLTFKRSTLGDVVAILHRHLLAMSQRCKIHLKPSCDDTAEVNEPRAVILPCDVLGR